MSPLSTRLAAWSVRHRGLVWCLLLTLSAFALLGHFDPRLVTYWFRQVANDTSSDRYTAGTSKTDRASEPTSKVQPINLSASDAVLVIESPDIFTPRGTEALRRVAERIEELPQVRRIFVDGSRSDAQHLRAERDRFLPKSTASEGKI